MKASCKPGSTETLRAILARLIPPDQAPGALACDIEPIVRARVYRLDEFLGRLKGFAGLDPDQQEAWLKQIDGSGDPDFNRLVEVAHEAYYADSRSWLTLGYGTGIPDQV